MMLETKGLRIFIYQEAIDMRCGFGAPGKAWRLQWVKFPPWKGFEPIHQESSFGLVEVTT